MNDNWIISTNWRFYAFLSIFQLQGNLQRLHRSISRSYGVDISLNHSVCSKKYSSAVVGGPRRSSALFSRTHWMSFWARQFWSVVVLWPAELRVCSMLSASATEKKLVTIRSSNTLTNLIFSVINGRWLIHYLLVKSFKGRVTRGRLFRFDLIPAISEMFPNLDQPRASCPRRPFASASRTNHWIRGNPNQHGF